MSATAARPSGLGEFLKVTADRQTVWVFVAFGVLLAILAYFVANLVIRQIDLEMLTERMDRAQDEAHWIAEAVAAVGRDRDGIDFHLLRQKQEILESIVNERLQEGVTLGYVEVRDRFGARLLFVAPETNPGSAMRLLPEELWPDDRPTAGWRVVRAPLTGRGPRPAGEVRVALSEEGFRQEVEELRRSLRVKAAVGAVIGVVVLALGLLTVLYLLRKNRRLEESRLAAERRSYVGLLASGLAHEIRNPLNAMNMNLQMLEEEIQYLPELQESDHRELLDSTKSEIKRLEALVNNFLAYARPTAPHFEPKDLNLVAQDIVRFLLADFRKSDIEMTLDLEPLLPTVDLDETQFRQAVMNLLVNARQVMRNGGSIVVRTRPGSGGEAVLEIQDDGPGIPDEAQARIFEVFFSSRGGGTGLGLPIAKQIVERHGGRIELDSQVGHGTTFRIRLPRRHVSTGERTAGDEAAS
jgi:signal transduction histidine kinase